MKKTFFSITNAESWPSQCFVTDCGGSCCWIDPDPLLSCTVSQTPALIQPHWKQENGFQFLPVSEVLGPDTSTLFMTCEDSIKLFLVEDKELCHSCFENFHWYLLVLKKKPNLLSWSIDPKGSVASLSAHYFASTRNFLF